MPKISKNKIRIIVDHIDEYVEAVIMYNLTHHFYFVISEVFEDIVNLLSDKEREKLGIFKKYKRAAIASEYVFIIVDDTEKGCLEKVKVCLKKLMTLSVKKKKVIIVFYNSEHTCRYSNHKYNSEHPQIGLQFGLTYADELSYGDSKSYYLNGEKLNLWDESAIIIPDSEENRRVLEQLYFNLNELNKKLKEFTSTPDSMLKAISSNIKMLNLGK